MLSLTNILFYFMIYSERLMAGPHCERLDGMASQIDLTPLPTDTASCAAPVSLSVRFLPHISVSLL